MNLYLAAVAIGAFGFLGPIESESVPQGQAASSTRVIAFAGGSVRVEPLAEAEKVTVMDADGHLASESTCYAADGTYDELVAFFRLLIQALGKADSAAVGRLVRFPLRINGDRRLSIRSLPEFQRQYVSIFPPSVVKKIVAAAPAAVFCRNGAAMIGNGEVWVSGQGGRVALDVVNR